MADVSLEEIVRWHNCGIPDERIFAYLAVQPEVALQYQKLSRRKSDRLTNKREMLAYAAATYLGLVASRDSEGRLHAKRWEDVRLLRLLEKEHFGIDGIAERWARYEMDKGDGYFRLVSRVFGFEPERVTILPSELVVHVKRKAREELRLYLEANAGAIGRMKDVAKAMDERMNARFEGDGSYFFSRERTGVPAEVNRALVSGVVAGMKNVLARRAVQLHFGVYSPLEGIGEACEMFGVSEEVAERHDLANPRPRRIKEVAEILSRSPYILSGAETKALNNILRHPSSSEFLRRFVPGYAGI